jgi:dienelactone hydrolase
MKTLNIPIGDSFIDGTLFHPEELKGSNPAVLFIHGWGGSEEHYREGARKIAGLGAICFTITLRGHGETSHQRETVSRTDNLHDALTALDRLLAEEGVDSQRIGVVGSSYGGYLAALLTRERNVRWLGLRAPALYKDEGFERPKRQLNQDPDLHAFRRRPVSPADNLALECCARFQGDVLVVESEHDTVIPHQVIANYLNALQRVRTRTHHVIRDADHALSNPVHRPEYEAVLCKWFKERFAEPLQAPSTS